MKKLLFFLVFVFVFSFPQKIGAQSCTCTVGINRQEYVSSPCPSGHLSKCTGDPYKGQLDCVCDVSQPGTNCVTSGAPPLGQTCCSGYVIESRSGVCIPNNVNPYPGATGAVKICDYAGDKKGECEGCMGSGDKVWTAIGCVPATLDGLVENLLPFAMGIAGGIAFILMLFGALQIMTSSGNPEKLNAGKELLTSAIVGLLLIIFSVFILRLVGVTILGIPGFS